MEQIGLNQSSGRPFAREHCIGSVASDPASNAALIAPLGDLLGGQGLGSEEEPGFLRKLQQIPVGYCELIFEGRIYKVLLRRSARSGAWSFQAEEVTGRDSISFNVYNFEQGKILLRVGHFAAKKVISFVVEFKIFTA